MYSVGRFCVLKEISEFQLKDLQAREVKRKFLLPVFNICLLYRIPEKAIIDLNDVNKQKLIDIFYRNLPDLSNLPGVTAPSGTDIDYVHAWDWCLWNNIEAKEFIKKHSGTKNDILDELRSHETHQKGAVDD